MVKYWEISSSRKGAGAVRYSNGDNIHEEGGAVATTEAGLRLKKMKNMLASAEAKAKKKANKNDIDRTG